MIKQGDIYYADLNPVKGREQSGIRPVIVIQRELLNKHLNTVIIVPITGNLQAKGLLTTFFLPAKNTGLKKDSIALLFQLRTIDKSRLTRKISTLTQAQISHIREQLTLLF